MQDILEEKLEQDESIEVESESTERDNEPNSEVEKCYYINYVYKNEAVDDAMNSTMNNTTNNERTIFQMQRTNFNELNFYISAI